MAYLSFQNSVSSIYFDPLHRDAHPTLTLLTHLSLCCISWTETRWSDSVCTCHYNWLLHIYRCRFRLRVCHFFTIPTYISVLYLICSLVSFDSSNSTPPLVSKGVLLFSNFAFAWYLCSCNVGFEILKNFSWLFLDKVPLLLVQVFFPWTDLSFPIFSVWKFARVCSVVWLPRC